jgi:hypothetical protein
MERLTIALGTAGLIGLAVWSAQAAPLAPDISATQNFSPLVQVGCGRGRAETQRCPYGTTLSRGGWCKPCWGGYGHGYGGGYGHGWDRGYGGGYRHRGYYGGYPHRQYYY